MTRTFFLFCILLAFAIPGSSQVTDSLPVSDSTTRSDTSFNPMPVADPLGSLLGNNKFLNSKAPAQELLEKKRRVENKNGIFYLLAGLLLFFGIIRTAYSRYFTNMFRVFFNSSLRQSQLTDQLVQDKLSSLLFNIFFVFSAGLYFYFLFQRTGIIAPGTHWFLIGACVLGLAAIYLGKYLVLQFTGWITGYAAEAELYTFIVFLINKIIGISLLPVLVVLAFSDASIARVFMILSFMLVGLLLVMRFFRSFSLLQHRIKVSRFHFFLYIFALEILPLLLIYKAVMIFFGFNL